MCFSCSVGPNVLTCKMGSLLPRPQVVHIPPGLRVGGDSALCACASLALGSCRLLPFGPPVFSAVHFSPWQFLSDPTRLGHCTCLPLGTLTAGKEELLCTLWSLPCFSRTGIQSCSLVIIPLGLQCSFLFSDAPARSDVPFQTGPQGGDAGGPESSAQSAYSFLRSRRRGGGGLLCSQG